MRRTRLLALPAAAALVATGLALAPAPARAAAPIRDSGPTQSVVLQLTPRDTALLAATAQQSAALAPDVRLSRLARAIAGAGRAAQVARISTTLGLHVAASTDYAVTVTGSEGRIHALFGSARASSPKARTAQPLPTLPTAYGALVTVADGGDETRPGFLPHTTTASTSTTSSPRRGVGNGPDGTLSVAQTRSLYGTSATTTPPATNAPIVATLQLAGWHDEPSDFPAFARANNIYPSSYDPMKTISTVAVNAGCTGPTTDGALEVALDQETLLAVAPQLRQRIYFAPNCGAAQDLALDQAASDVGKGSPILAFSTSWGGCEEQTYSTRQEAQADLNAVNTAAAAGITVFAASGDDGSYDCLNDNGSPDQADAVDSPAVIPGVVGVGGTSLTAGGGQSTWNDAIGASGGGFSCGVYARPAYQSAVAQSPTYPHNGFGCTTGSGATARQVPDIAADAGDGLSVVEGGYSQAVYGTSFGAPLSAGGYAQTLYRAGRSRGLGIISGLLYQQVGGAGFRDVTTGNNEDYAAGTGYDLATGLGSAQWPTLLGSAMSLSAIGQNQAGYATIQAANNSYWGGSPTVVTTTPLQLGDAGQWELFTAPYRGDQANDLWAVRLTGGGSGKVEVHVLSQASGYQTFLAHIATAQNTLDPANWLVRAGSYAGDGASDLFLVGERGTGSGKVEVHVLSQTSGYGKYLGHFATALASPASGWAYLIGDKAGSGDLVAVSYASTGSGRTEVHALTRASGYGTFSQHTATAFPLQTGNVQFSLADVNADKVPDLLAATLSGTRSGDVEVAAYAGTAYTKLATSDVTALPAQPNALSVGLPQ